MNGFRGGHSVPVVECCCRGHAINRALPVFSPRHYVRLGVVSFCMSWCSLGPMAWSLFAVELRIARRKYIIGSPPTITNITCTLQIFGCARRDVFHHRVTKPCANIGESLSLPATISVLYLPSRTIEEVFVAEKLRSYP